MKDWTAFLSSIYGGLSTNVVVFVIPHNELTEDGSASVENVQQLVNFDMELDSQIKWYNYREETSLMVILVHDIKLIFIYIFD